MSTQVGRCPTLIGRAADVATIAQAAAQIAAGGRGAMVVVSGEAGVGKSRLASEAIRLAEVGGLRAMIGNCRSDDGGAYAPFVSAVRRRIRTSDDDELGAPVCSASDPCGVTHAGDCLRHRRAVGRAEL